MPPIKRNELRAVYARILAAGNTGAIVGVGAARRVSAVRWNIAKNIVVAWVITMPMAGVIAAIFYALARSVG